MRYTIRFWFTWPADVHERCRLLNAGGGWRHGVIHHENGLTLRESVSLKGVVNASLELAEELAAQGIDFDYRAIWSAE